MAHSLSAKKRVRQNAKRRSYNRWRLRSMRTAIKAFDEAELHHNADGAAEAFKSACQLLDKTASKGVIHKRTAARKKSRLNSRLKKLRGIS